MGIFEWARKRNEKIPITDFGIVFPTDKYNTAYKRLAIESVIGYIARIIIQSEFRHLSKGEYKKDNIYYQLNVKPNRNHSASQFWYEVVYKLIYDGECLIVTSRDGELLVADDFLRDELAVREDKFKKVFVENLELEGVFKRSEVIYLEYGNEKLRSIVHGLFEDYGALIGQMFKAQMMKGQVRATVDVDGSFLKTEEGLTSLQNFIDKVYKAFDGKAFGVAPQQKGMEYQEHSKQGSVGQSAEEIDKVNDAFMDQICHAVGLPPNILKGDMADIEGSTRNAMKFCIDPIIKMISDELNMQLLSKREYLNDGARIEVRRISYRDMFDVAVAVDKLRSSSVVNGHELRDELGLEYSDDEIHDKYILTKNYTDSSGGDSEIGEEET